MGQESANYLNDLVSTNPVSASDLVRYGAYHLRTVKSAAKNTFAGFAGAVVVRSTETGTAAAHVLTPTPALISYTTGMMLLYSPVNAGTGALTVNVSALGAKSVKLINGADPTSGDVVANQPLLLMYDGTNFVCIGGSPYMMKTGNQTITGNTTFSGTLSVPTPTLGAQAATKAYVDSLAFSTALPAQAGNDYKFVRTLASVTSWEYVFGDPWVAYSINMALRGSAYSL